jgi:hypothetical protein
LIFLHRQLRTFGHPFTYFASICSEGSGGAKA